MESFSIILAMFTPELKEFDDYRSGFSPEDRRFLETVQFRLYEQPSRSKLRDVFGSSKTPKILLVSAIGTTLVGLVLGSPEIFAGGICLSSLWQTGNWVSRWRDYLAIET